jgi:arylsulfatase A-like enzyme
VGDYKIVSAELDADQWELYNLAVDRGEIHNLAATEPPRLAAMAARWQQLADEFARQAGPGVPQKKGGRKKPPE